MLFKFVFVLTLLSTVACSNETNNNKTSELSSRNGRSYLDDTVNYLGDVPQNYYSNTSYVRYPVNGLGIKCYMPSKVNGAVYHQYGCQGTAEAFCKIL